jgi:hypothetical protein
MLATTLGDPQKDFAVSAGALRGNKADPGFEMSSVLELRSIPNGSHNNGGRFGPHTLDRGNSLTSFIAAKNSVNLLVIRSDPTIQIHEEIIKFGDRLTGHGGQLVVEVRQDVGNLAPIIVEPQETAPAALPSESNAATFRPHVVELDIDGSSVWIESYADLNVVTDIIVLNARLRSPD